MCSSDLRSPTRASSAGSTCERIRRDAPAHMQFRGFVRAQPDQRAIRMHIEAGGRERECGGVHGWNRDRERQRADADCGLKRATAAGNTRIVVVAVYAHGYFTGNAKIGAHC